MQLNYSWWWWTIIVIISRSSSCIMMTEDTIRLPLSSIMLKSILPTLLMRQCHHRRWCNNRWCVLNMRRLSTIIIIMAALCRHFSGRVGVGAAGIIRRRPIRISSSKMMFLLLLESRTTVNILWIINRWTARPLKRLPRATTVATAVTSKARYKYPKRNDSCTHCSTFSPLPLLTTTKSRQLHGYPTVKDLL